jgi:t-SNARE complex subunit (syntaxin)
MNKVSLNIFEFQNALAALETTKNRMSPSIDDVLEISNSAKTMHQYRKRLNRYASVLNELQELLQYDLISLQGVEKELTSTDKKLSDQIKTLVL